MEESGNRVDLSGHVLRPSSLRTGGAASKSTSSGRSTPRGSSFRRSGSGRTPRRDTRGGGSFSQYFRGNRVVLWLLLITLWAYAGFYVQSKWAHENRKEGLFGHSVEPDDDENSNLKESKVASNSSLEVKSANSTNESILRNTDVVLAKKQNVVPARKALEKKPMKSKRASHRKPRGKPNPKVKIKTAEPEAPEPEILLPNSTYGLVVGPFGSLEDEILEWSPEKRSATCDRKGQFARLVWSRKFLLILHELSMTGAPLSMMELGSELLSCGASVSVVVLNRKGGLMPELARRKIHVLEDRADLSFKTAWKVDLVIAGSAVCASWIEQYLSRYPAGAYRIAWWIMENRKEYFDRSKPVLNRVKMLIFLSESQSKQWQAWSTEENTTLSSEVAILPLSVNDELAFVAGIASSLNTPKYGPEKMLEKRKLLRNAVRKQMGLKDNAMLVLSLSSINAGKGQLLLLESARIHQASSRRSNARKLGSEIPGIMEPSLKILIGSVGSKSNKALYVEEMLSLISSYSNLSKSVLWTPVTTRVASLYSAADVYVINSQGLGETFGRVTIEAMAFGLPVLGTDAGGTKDLVEHNITGILHPLGRPGARDLSKNLQFLLENPSARHKMGTRGRNKVEKMYLKRHMYKDFAEVLIRCMRIK